MNWNTVFQNVLLLSPFLEGGKENDHKLSPYWGSEFLESSSRDVPARALSESTLSSSLPYFSVETVVVVTLAGISKCASHFPCIVSACLHSREETWVVLLTLYGGRN